MKLAITFCCAFSVAYCNGQIADSFQTVQLQNVIVTSYKSKPLEQSILNIANLKIDSLNQFGNYNLTDLMAKTPGVTMLSTGIAIAKPVIRGLYGNRILVLLSGLKFDNQQWQEEHGLGLSDLGLAKVELIKGAMSVLYGTEAIGGIVNLVEAGKTPLQTQTTDIGFRFNTNTLGGLTQIGMSRNDGDKWRQLRFAVENHADYSDGKNQRVLNSRFDGYNFKGTWGFQKGNWTSNNHILTTFNRYGFIFNDVYDFVQPDARWSRRLNVNPAHLVILNILSSENKKVLENDAILHFNVGLQSNERMEKEGGGKISLNMHLLTLQYLLKWEKELSAKNRWIVSNLGSLELNSNFGARKIVPNAFLQESNVSTYLETQLQKNLLLENGVGLGEKWIRTFNTPTVNSPEKEIQPFSKFSPYYNWFTGVTYFPDNQLNIKANIATGVRIPNLAELSSNGLHEGIFTYEIGNPLLKNEQNIAFNLFAQYNHSFFEISISPFYNLFYNYVYLTPTNEKWFGFHIYRYQQQNAIQYGTEGSLTVKPSHDFQFKITYSGMNSQTADGNYTPYLPAQKIVPHVLYNFNLKNEQKIQIFSELEYCEAQTHVAPFELATPAYRLWNVGASTAFTHAGKMYRFSLTGNNLGNESYYDHLSRFKNFGLLNIGRNIALNFKMNFQKPLKIN